LQLGSVQLAAADPVAALAALLAGANRAVVAGVIPLGLLGVTCPVVLLKADAGTGWPAFTAPDAPTANGAAVADVTALAEACPAIAAPATVASTAPAVSNPRIIN